MAERPKRIQRKRTKGWRMPEGAVYVGRGTVFGNLTVCCRPHYCSLKPCGCCPVEDSCCVKSYREYMESGLRGERYRGGSIGYLLEQRDDGSWPERAELVRRLPELRGKDLACWCPLDVPCHADVLLKLANKET